LKVAPSEQRELSVTELKPSLLKISDKLSVRFQKTGSGPALLLLHTIRTQLEYFRSLAPLRAFDGVKSARAVRQAENPTRLLFIDVFASRKDADAYFQWRRSTGDLDLLATLVSEPPVIEVWPLMAGSPG